MRILVDAVAARTGGGPSRVRELAKTFPELGPNHDFLFVVPRSLQEEVLAMAPRIEVRSPPPSCENVPARLLWEHGILPLVARRWKADVAFSPFNILPVLWPPPRPGLVCLVSNLAPYAPEILDLYTGSPLRRLLWLRRLTDRSLSRADRILLLSSQGLRMINSKILHGVAEVIPMAPPLTEERNPVPPEALGGSYFLVVSDLMRYKRVETVIRALGQLHDGQVNLLVCGKSLEPGYGAWLKEEVQRLGLAGRVMFLGTRDHREVLGLMANSVAYVNASLFENGARVAVEAMAMAAPVLASRVPAFVEVCDDAATYFEPDRPDQLAEAMGRILVDRALRERQSARGRHHVAAMTHGSASDRILRAIERVAGV